MSSTRFNRGASLLRSRLLMLAGTVALLVAALAASAATATRAELVARGEYLATAGDCISCHTRPSGAAFAGGRALNTPFGILISANITPDIETGIGRWSETQFARALREGIAADGSHLYPAFPYTAYTLLTDADVSALYAYFRTLPAVRFTPPPNAMRFPFGIRSALAVWKAMFLKSARYVPDATQSAEWNRGAYLTQGLGHCGACHTPRNFLGAERSSLALSGGEYLDDIADEVLDEKVTPLVDPTVRSWSTANLTPTTSGLGSWSLDEIVDYLKTGHNTRAGAFGPMIEVIDNSLSRLTEPDRRAIAVYLKSLPPQTRSAAVDANDARLMAGAAIYTTRCGDCHQPTGLGMPWKAGATNSKTAPPLAGNAALQAPSPATLINVILYGAHGGVLSVRSAATWPWPRMSGFELSVGLDDEQIAALCTYVRSSWGNRAGAVSAADIANQR